MNIIQGTDHAAVALQALTLGRGNTTISDNIGEMLQIHFNILLKNDIMLQIGLERFRKGPSTTLFHMASKQDLGFDEIVFLR